MIGSGEHEARQALMEACAPVQMGVLHRAGGGQPDILLLTIPDKGVFMVEAERLKLTWYPGSLPEDALLKP